MGLLAKAAVAAKGGSLSASQFTQCGFRWLTSKLLLD
jgi:hypothetical protein